MSEAGAIPRRRKILKYLLWATAVWLVFLAGIGWYITTDSFQALVRRRLISEIELVTGGRVELGSFHTSPFRLRVEVLNLTIHGREKRDELPYVQVPKVVAQVKVISALGFEFGFHSVVLEHPSIHILTYADGTTNQPTPKVRYLAEEKPLQRLFDLSIGELEVRDGELLWNEQRIPLDFQANDVSADMTYSVLHQRYFGNLLLGKIVTRVQDFRPVAWMAEAHFALGSGSLNIGSLMCKPAAWSTISASRRSKLITMPSWIWLNSLTSRTGRSCVVGKPR
jgi:translocation and assembly module TamB